MNPKYPVYIISKGRWERRSTAASLDRIGVPYRVVIEPQEVELYTEAGLDPRFILTLPFSNLGQGSIPARNWVWDHAAASGADRHWILDDNLNGFFRLYRNLKTPVASGTIFRVAEHFVDRYANVAMAGMNYFKFASRKTVMPPFYLNTRIYSCILLRNDIAFRWRGRYNEDTDLSLRILKAGFCTVLFNAFLVDKQNTMTMAGGNTDDLYEGNGRLKMAESLAEQHPDVARVSEKWGRAQHHVDYTPFQRNKLLRIPGVPVPEGTDNFGMVLQDRIGEEWVTRHAEPAK